MKAMEEARMQAASTIRFRESAISRPSARGQGCASMRPRPHGSANGCDMGMSLRAMSALPQKQICTIQKWMSAASRHQVLIRFSTRVSLFIEERADRLHRRVRLLLHDPMSGICDDAALNIGADLAHDCSL